MYLQNKELRHILFGAIQSIEIAFRSKVIHHVALAHGAFWFTDFSIVVRQNCFRENLYQIKKELKRSKEEFIQEDFQKYTSPDVPHVWKTLKITSFGLLSKLFCCSNTKCMATWLH